MTPKPDSGAGAQAGSSSYTAAPSTIEQIIQQVAMQIASSTGVDPSMLTSIALATAQVESGFDPNSVGDGGHSVGLFQLNDGGEGAGMSVQAREDPTTNAQIAIRVIASVMKQHPDWSGGQIAAAAQRPADQSGYAVNVNNLLANPGQLSSGNHPIPTVGAAASGGTGATTTGGTDAQQALSPNATPAQQQQWFQQHYGYLAGYLAVPELHQILVNAAEQNIDPTSAAGSQQIQAMLQGSNWWQTHSDTFRQWSLLYATDPAAANQKIQQAIVSIDDEAQQMGVTIPQQRLNDMAINSIAYGWTADQLKMNLGAELQYNPKLATQPGTFGTTITQLSKTAADYLVPVAQPTIAGYAQKILEGAQTPDNFTAYAQQLAESKFGSDPNLLSAMQRGITPSQYFDPYKQQTAQLLEISPEQVDLMNNPQFSKMLTMPDPQSGTQRPMTLSEAATYVRGLPQWSNTLQAQQESATLGRSLLNTLGAAKI